MTEIKTRKKLIEVGLPLNAINRASVKEKNISAGHPSSFHIWWARRPLAAARAVLFGQLVNDPSAHPELFPTKDLQNKERQRLFRLMEELVLWNNTRNSDLIDKCRREIMQSWEYTCEDNQSHPEAKIQFDQNKLPAFHDPFAGGGSLPLEAQRLGLESFGSDLNPVSVLINKAMIEIPSKFFGTTPINPASRKKLSLFENSWNGSEGITEDINYYTQLISDKAKKKIGNHYPYVNITSEMIKDRPDLDNYLGSNLTVMGIIWARTVRSPNPAFSQVEVPLMTTYILSKNKNNLCYVEPRINNGEYSFEVKTGNPFDPDKASRGTKSQRGANFFCLLSGSPISGDYIKTEGIQGRMGSRMVAIVAEGPKGRIYLSPTPEQELAAQITQPDWKPETKISGSTQYLGIKPYGMERFDQLFTNRQLTTLVTFSELIQDVREIILEDAISAKLPSDGIRLEDGGSSAEAYADAISIYLSLNISKQANRACTLNFWDPGKQSIQQVFARQALSMTWDFVEGNPFSNSSGNFMTQIRYLTNVLSTAAAGQPRAEIIQEDAQKQTTSLNKIISTDPPYYDNIPYADLSDFFYVWLRKCLDTITPNLFTTLASPKSTELVAFAYRHKDGKTGAEEFFLDGMRQALSQLSDLAHPAFPTTIYYAFRQSETKGKSGLISTGWETFLTAVIESGFSIEATWPLQTESTKNLKNTRNALASSIVLVCRNQIAEKTTISRREFISELRKTIPSEIDMLQITNIAPVDLAQAAIGPGISIFSRYSRVLNADGESMSVGEALGLINRTLDEFMVEQEGDYDSETRWAISWFETVGFSTGNYGEAESLSIARVTSVNGLILAGIVESGAGKVRLLRPEELASDWDPISDSRLTAWEAVHHLIKSLDSGEKSAAQTFSKLSSEMIELAKELTYRLYSICEQKNWAEEAFTYNSLIQSWPEIEKLARLEPPAQQGSLI